VDRSKTKTSTGQIAPKTKKGKMKTISISPGPIGQTANCALNAVRSITILACCLAASIATPCAQASSTVLPPAAAPLGYSLDQMAAAVANFSISGNDPSFYPNTPFQIIYRRPGNSFTVKPGTYCYVKFFFIDDSPPVVGDWPANKSDAANYVFGNAELGGHDLEIEVDGSLFSLDDPGHIGGPVLTPNSPDGSSHLIQIGAFLAPLAKGTHAVTIRGVFDGDALVNAFGGPLTAEISYSITVQ
jgi:hypothetical protein